MVRALIVNADDFGRSAGINDGVIRAHEQGIVTSASLMVRWPTAVQAAALAHRTPTLSIGLHLDLGEWEYVDGEWRALYEVGGTAAEQLARQLVRFEELVGRPPTHLDSHQHVHRDPAVGRPLADAATRLGIPVRDQSPEFVYSGEFYGQDGRGYPSPDRITAGALVAIIETLREGVTELGCHPAAADDVPGMYRAERLLELEALCDPQVRRKLDESGIQLRSFLPDAAPP
jgi:chitin disaccharide deacetylase